MDYFLDTNVELGYVFCTDPWNTSATTVFDSNDDLHYSKNVDIEFQKNFSKFLKEQKQFFLKGSELNINEFYILLKANIWNGNFQNLNRNNISFIIFTKTSSN